MTSLRITAGALRGRRLSVPPRDVRPTAERARQAFFNIVGPRIDGARFLDLFAGSGIFSFEAVSRGASAATAVDRERRNAETIDRMAKEWNVPVKSVAGEVLDVLRAMTRSTFETFDIVYADPPYDYAVYDELLQTIDRLPLSPGAVVAIEHRRRSDPFGQWRTAAPAVRTGEGGCAPRRLRQTRRAEYGEVWITLFAA